MSEKRRQSAESRDALYTVFSILSAYTIQSMIYPTLQSDPNVVITIWGFLASFIFLILKVSKPEVRIVSRAIKKSLESDKKLLEFIIGCDILFKGWKLDSFAITHRWKNQIVDRTQILPEDPTIVPNSNSTITFYSLLFLPLFSWLIYSLDIMNVIFFEIIVVIFGVVILYFLNSFTFNCIKYLIEFETLRDYLMTFNETEGNQLGVPDVEIVYDMNKEVLITHDTLKEYIPHLERMVRKQQWERFISDFEDFELLFLGYLKDMIPLIGVNDLIVSWSTYFQDSHKKLTVKHQFKRIREAHKLWSEITKTETKISNLGTVILFLPDLLTFINTVSIEDMRGQEAEAVASVINIYIPSQDIRFNQLIEILCTKLRQYGEQMKNNFAEKMIQQCLGSETYLVHVLSSTIDYWSSEYKITREKSVEDIKSALDGRRKDDGMREEVVRLFKSMSEPSFENQSWEAYRRYTEARTLSRLPIYNALLKAIESDINLPSSKMLENLLFQAPRSVWTHCGSKGLDLLIEQYNNSPDREVEMAIIEIVSSSSEVNRIRMVTEFSKENIAPSHGIMASIIDCLFSGSDRVRIGISSALLKMTKKLKQESILIERVSMALNDPHVVVRKNIQKLMKDVGNESSD